MKLVESKRMYEFDLDTVRNMFAEAVEAKPEQITVEYAIREVGGDPMDRYPGTLTVVAVNVTVKL